MEREERGGMRERRVFQTEERDRVKMGAKRWEVCVCVCVCMCVCVEVGSA